ncbi:MAG: T9SS type A sorting domain-containing protein [Prolixibacteraceae bacterium]
MKQLIILLALSTVIPFHCLSQGYETIIRPDTSIWYFGNRQMSGDFIDTIFAGEKVGDWTNIYYKGKFYNHELTFAGKVNTNETNSKIWYISPESEDTLLIFNLDLNIGDSILYPYEYYPVDTIYYENEKKIIEFNLPTEWGKKCQFIEGVGPNLTFLLHWKEGVKGGINGIVVCKFDGDEHVYTINSPLYFDDCNVLNTGISTIWNKTIKIYPNPVGNYLEIEIDNTQQEYEISVKDLKGSIIIKQKSTCNCKLNTSMLKKGNYLLTVQSANNCFNFKIVKE